MGTEPRKPGWLAAAMLLAGTAALCGCPSSQADAPAREAPRTTPPVSTPPAKQPEPPETPETPALGPPSSGLAAALEAPPDPSDPCAPLGTIAQRIAGGQTLPRELQRNPDTETIGTAPMMRALPLGTQGWRRVGPEPRPRGFMGAATDSALSRLERGEQSVEVHLVDQIHGCTCAAGMGREVARRAVAASPGGRELEVQGHPGSITQTESRRALAFWIADRCEVSIEQPTAMAESVLFEAARALDLAALREPCARR